MFKNAFIAKKARTDDLITFQITYAREQFGHQLFSTLVGMEKKMVESVSLSCWQCPNYYPWSM